MRDTLEVDAMLIPQFRACLAHDAGSTSRVQHEFVRTLNALTCTWSVHLSVTTGIMEHELG